ncbi:DeoR/GlpR family DNA-binding transcription regulator [Pseudoflavonifractor sp. CLA-AP-H29]|uniref:DeoR/GlpR family DNA-binding transcription regulator n=1 Tax=Pseudoflavonifractor intestinihominis TaxID=3133171 RepID=A0ABV1EEG5_9FIRM
MLTQERYQQILQMLARKRTVTVAELTQTLGASEATIRRDLNALHEMGRLNKVHGGATALSSPFATSEADVRTKSALNVEEKVLIGRYAATLIEDDDFVYIDAGSTTEKLVEAIGESRATFVTNGIAHAQHLARKGLKSYILGGELKPATEAVVGAVAARNLQKYNFTKCFMGANGISAKAGFTTPDAEEGMLKSEAFSRSYMAYVLADHTKFDWVSPVSFAPIDKACIITDHLPDESYRSFTIIEEVSHI